MLWRALLAWELLRELERASEGGRSCRERGSSAVGRPRQRAAGPIDPPQGFARSEEASPRQIRRGRAPSRKGPRPPCAPTSAPTIAPSSSLIIAQPLTPLPQTPIISAVQLIGQSSTMHCSRLRVTFSPIDSCNEVREKITNSNLQIHLEKGA